MKLTFQILLHVMAVSAGFWLVATDPPVKPKAAPIKAAPKGPQPAQIPANQVRVSSKPRVETRMAALTPETWANELAGIERLSLADLPAALRGALSARFPVVRWRLVGALFKRWALLDRVSALAALRTIPSPQMKATALRAILTHWTETDERSAWQWVTALDDDSVLQEVGIESLLSHCAGKDPANYVAWAEMLEDPFLRFKALNQIAAVWARTDAPGALAAALTTSNDVLRMELLEQACHRNESGIDRAEAMELILQLPNRAQRIQAVSDHWMGEFASEDPARALQWFVAHAGNPDLQQAGGNLGKLWATQARSAMELRASILQIPPGPARDAFAAQAATSWATHGNATRVREARELLTLCAPCIEREDALAEIESAFGHR
jgi:hypothetical protein